MLGISQSSNHLNEYIWRNIINSILSTRTYINTSIILLPTILLSLLFSLSSTLFRTFQSLCIMISSCSRLALTRLAGLTLSTSLRALQSTSLSLSSFLPQISSDYVQVSTWNHLKGNSCEKSGHMWGYWSFAHVCIFPYTLLPIGPAPRCTWTLISGWMALSGRHFCRWNQPTPPSSSHLYTRLGVVWGLEPYPCHSTPSES